MKPIDTEVFERKFDDNQEDILEYLDLSQATRVHQNKIATRRVNVDFPLWMLESLDREAANLGVARQALIKMWLSQHLPPNQQNI
ncbi:type II toxin-antitoxin system BrnA family antitoxin [Alysiella filiformis]|uniref:CopG antitoxin of type II toxin-antitoxin system n=1 Tax=Alysiella filiformis DSM 16848 TaxID=1120981 RepID=A0A286E6R2_9NEIS|nr:CopG family antitoxin [Alysiella filiformis]QMT31512.1 CopG family transcriptional regulator [Alysiella filiformis]UBQ55476.1 BrnA antitoxin family protein [Alysiella filiformis DSM 16848]SOD66554.1 CopG antitoxin of type II toxin-antitoxin system [Alysiella filiformis DSM 16848]